MFHHVTAVVPAFYVKHVLGTSNYSGQEISLLFHVLYGNSVHISKVQVFDVCLKVLQLHKVANMLTRHKILAGIHKHGSSQTHTLNLVHGLK